MKFAARAGTAARTLSAIAPAGPSRESVAYAGNSPGSRERHHVPSTVEFARSRVIFPPDQGYSLVYIVRSGCVRLSKTLPDGRSINVGLLGPGTVFAQEDRSDEIATGVTAEAVVDSTVSVVDLESLTAIVAESPALALAIVNGLSHRITELQTLVEQLLVRDTGVRLATTLLGLATRFGRPAADGMTAITQPLTHQALAGMIGSNRVTVTRKLLHLQELGFIRHLGRNTIAIDRAKLLRFARGPAESART